MTVLTLNTSTPPTFGRCVRDEIDQLHADYLDLAHRTALLAAALDRGEYASAGGRVRAAVSNAWRAAEDLHAAFHTAPPRAPGPDVSLARLCGRRMRYLAGRIAKRAA